MNKNSWHKFYVLLSIVALFYIIFHIIFFIFLANLSVDGLIGLSMILLFCSIYRFGGIHIDRFFLSISKNIWLHFITLISLAYLIKKLFIDFVKLLKKNLVFQIISNYLIFFELRSVLNELNIMLSNRYAFNIVLFEILYKQIVINNLLDKNVICNEIIFLSQEFIYLNAYYSYNTVGWLK